jgi:hypothetical protein
MEEQDTFDMLICDIDGHIHKLQAAAPGETQACRDHREGTVLLLRCQRIAMVAQKNSASEARKAGGLVAAVVAAAAAFVQWLLTQGK